jgi:hypothetical protein
MLLPRLKRPIGIGIGILGKLFWLLRRTELSSPLSAGTTPTFRALFLDLCFRL